MHVKFPVTVHMLFFQDEMILLSRRYKTGYMDGYFSVPAGHLDGGESIFQAACREAREETGVIINEDDISFANVIHRKEEEERIDFFVFVNHWEKEPINMEPQKCDNMDWYCVDKLPDNLVPYVREGLHNALKGIVFSEFGWTNN